jgi:hypothetical protein
VSHVTFNALDANSTLLDAARPTSSLDYLSTRPAEIADLGVEVIIAGSSVGELAMQYLDLVGIAVLKVLSKFELRRLYRVDNATPLARVGAATPEEAG